MVAFFVVAYVFRNYRALLPLFDLWCIIMVH